MARVKLKHRASVIIEPLIALTIISVILTIGVIIFNNLGGNNNGVIKLKAEEKIDSLRALHNYESDIYDFETFVIEKDVYTYGNVSDLLQIDWRVINLKNQELFTFSEIVNVSDED